MRKIFRKLDKKRQRLNSEPLPFCFRIFYKAFYSVWRRRIIQIALPASNKDIMIMPLSASSSEEIYLRLKSLISWVSFSSLININQRRHFLFKKTIFIFPTVKPNFDISALLISTWSFIRYIQSSKLKLYTDSLTLTANVYSQ